jgi:integrase
LLLASAQPGFDRTLFETAYLTGAREDGRLALRWTDLELPKDGPGKLMICRSLSWAKLKVEVTRPRFFLPKTKAGHRTISIPALLVSELKRWKLQCPPSDKHLVFPTPEGKPMCRDRLLGIAFYPTLGRARLRRVTFHSLRHSCASAMIANGAPITEVQHRLGHANPAITLLVYAHFFKCSEDSSADKMADLILGSGQQSAKLGKSGHSDRPHCKRCAISA